MTVHCLFALQSALHFALRIHVFASVSYIQPKLWTVYFEDLASLEKCIHK